MGRLLGILLAVSILVTGWIDRPAPGAAAPSRPKVAFSTFLGGADVDVVNDVAVDRAGNVYVVGSTRSADLPAINGPQDSYAGGSCDFDEPCTDGFVAKLSSDGQTVVYLSYLGGTGNDVANAVAVDAEGNAYVTGGAGSYDFPVTSGAFQTERAGGGPDVFVMKLGPSGSLIYSTFVGGESGWGDTGLEIALDRDGSAVVTGRAESANYPTTPGAYKTRCTSEPNAIACDGFADAFVTKLNPSGTDLIFSTFLGGDEFDEWGHAVAVDRDGNAYVAGDTASDDFPTTPGAFDATAPVGIAAFVTKLDSTGSRLVYSTVLAGSSSEAVLGIDVDEEGAAYVAGWTESTDFPTTAGSFDPRCGGLEPRSECDHTDGFVTKLHPSGASLVYSSYLGGYAYDEAHGLTVDAAGRAWVVGGTASSDFPLVRPVQSKLRMRQCQTSDCFDGFLARVDRSGDSLDLSTFYGGHSLDLATSVAVHEGRFAHVAGWTHSPGFPVADAFDPQMQSAKTCEQHVPFNATYRCTDGFLLRVRDAADPDTHPRRVTLKLRRHLAARGRVEVSTGYAGCAKRVPVVVFRATADETKRVARVRTNRKGRYRTKLQHREAVYFVRLPEVTKRSGDVCQRAESVGEAHFHPTP